MSLNISQIKLFFYLFYVFIHHSLFLQLCVSLMCVMSFHIFCNATKITLESLANKNSRCHKRHMLTNSGNKEKKNNIIQFSKILARSPYNDMCTVCSCWITPAVWCSEPVIRFNGCSILYSCHLTSPDWRSSTSAVPCSVGQDKLSVAVTFPKHVSMQNTNL